MHLAPALLITLTVAVAGLAGCVVEPAGPAASNLPAATPDPPSTVPLLHRTGCVGYNAITFVDGAAMRAHVPANWTFTSPTGSSDLAILRIHVVACDATEAGTWRFHLILSTPMKPDEASAHHHDNPDAILAVYSDDPDVVSNMSAAGVTAHNATFAWTEATTGDTVDVTTDGVVLHLVTLDAHRDATGTYVWPATYSAGREDIRWFWSHENASTRPVGLIDVKLGPSSPVPGIKAVQWSVYAWLGFDVRYVTGTPPES